VSGLDYFTFVVLAVLVGVVIWLAVLLGGLPGKLAAQRAHPQEDAVRVAGWLGLLSLGLLWPFALIWAFWKSPGSDEVATLRTEVARLEAQLAAANSEGGASS
jgi:hypothetical protein